MTIEQHDTGDVFGGTLEPTGADKLDDASLERWMRTNIDGFSGPISVTKFKGGQSNPTYRLATRSGDYVLRRKPFGPLLPSAHAVDREYHIQAALSAAGFPVAPQLGLCTDDGVIGSWFYVMAMIDGRTIWDGAVPGTSPQIRRQTYEAMIDTLAALHRVDVESAGLSDFGRPGNYFARQVDRWTSQYRLSQTDELPEMERLIDWLPATIPEQAARSIVHGDYRIDNIILAKDRPEVLAVLDWELSTLGDPLADLTYFAMAWATDNEGRSGVRDLDRRALGIPELDEMIERYCAATGRSAVPAIDWYLAYNFFRFAAIVQGIKKRIIDGTASSAHAKAMAERIGPLSNTAWHYAKRAGA